MRQVKEEQSTLLLDMVASMSNTYEAIRQTRQQQGYWTSPLELVVQQAPPWEEADSRTVRH
jgi:chromosome condensin MukBEF ATPase and DNA-binding subunit MukB